MPLSEYIKYILIAILTFLSTFLVAQVDNQSTDYNSGNKWKKYTKSNGVLIEYCFKENHPKRGYNSDFLILKITNKSTKNKLVSWDFSPILENGKCINCDSKNEELHYESEVARKSYKAGNIHSYQLDPLVIFHHFKDENYKGKSTTKWNKFNLKNLIIK